MIHYSFTITGDHPHKKGSIASLTASNTGSNRFHLILKWNAAAVSTIPTAVRLQPQALWIESAWIS